MPSHTIHKKWAKKLGIPSKISELVDKIIDGNNPWKIHDLGKDISEPMHEPIKRGRVTISFPRVKVQTWDLLQYVLKITFPERETYTLAVKAAILHHFLDGIHKFLREYGLHYSKKDYANIALNYSVEYASDVYPLDPEMFKLIEKFVDENKVEIILDIIAKELRNRENVEYGPGTVIMLLSEIRRVKRWPGNIHIIGKKLYFFAPGARAIYGMLKSGEKVKFCFAYSGHTRMYKYNASPTFELEPPIEKAVKKLMQIYEDLSGQTS